MSYFKDIDAWLDNFLSRYPTDDEIRSIHDDEIRSIHEYIDRYPDESEIQEMRDEIKARLLESYRNGQAAQTTKDETPHEGSSRSASAAWRPKRKA